VYLCASVCLSAHTDLTPQSCRRLDNRLNVFSNILENYMFLGIFVAIVVGQIIIIQFGGVAFKTVPLDADMWGISFAIGFLSLPIGVITRLIPDDILCCKAQDEEQEEEDHIVYNHGQVQWQSAINQVRTQLQVFRTLRGGRLYAATAAAVASGTAVTGLDPFGTNHYTWDGNKPSSQEAV
jgi:Ca2+-transporting ATPase